MIKKAPTADWQRRMKNRADDDEDGDEIIAMPPIEMFAQFQAKEQQELERRGIIMVLGEISKESLARASKQLLIMHYDPNFNEEIQIILNSPGGYTDAGWAFIDLMSFIRPPVTTIAMGEICSMATNIFVAGDKRIMAPNSCAMIHEFSWHAAGNYSDLLASRKAEDMEYKRELDHLIKCSKYKTAEDIKKNLLLDHDHWLTPEEMKDHGLCDEIFKPRVRRKLAKKAKK